MLQCGDIQNLVKKRKTSDETPVYYIWIEETLDIINRIHIATGHGCRIRMLKELQAKYAKVQRNAIELLKSIGIECQRNQKQPMTKEVVVKSNLSNDFFSHGRVDLIYMLPMSHKTYN